MKDNSLLASLMFSVFAWTTDCPGATTPLASPIEITGGVTINFNGYADYTVANTLYQNQGLTFTRDDGTRIYLLDWTALGRVTTSPDGVLATVRDVATDPTWATHLNVISTAPVYAIGAYFGNDQADPDFATIRMSAFAANGELLGSVEARVNDNTDVDQFIGLRSDMPFTRVRFENLSSVGGASRGYSVVIDDLVFALKPPVVDSDGDGVPDAEDECPNTTGGVTDAHGCSIEQLVPCDGPRSGGVWRNHGQYVSALADVVEEFLKLGLITDEEEEALVRTAAQSRCARQ